jgi:hypothetical protein
MKKSKVMKVIDFVKLNEVEIKNKLIELDLFDEDDIDDVEFVENIDDEEICGGEDMGFDLSFNKNKVNDFDVETFELKINDKILYGCYYSF